MERLERDRIKNNILIQGLKIVTDNKVNLNLGSKIQIKKVTKIATTFCKIQLNSMMEKEIIIKNKNKLRFVQDRIYINNELTREDRETQKK